MRRALRADLDALAQIGAAAFHDKYRPAFGRDAAAGARALAGALIGHPDARILVAELDGRVAGAVQLLLGPGPADGAMGRAVEQAVGPLAALRASLVLGLLRPPEVPADRAYLDGLAVAPWARRRGVARALLDECAALARSAGLRGVLLLVTEDNRAARDLYEGAGLRVVERRRWWLARAVFRSPGAVVMEWPL